MEGACPVELDGANTTYCALPCRSLSQDSIEEGPEIAAARRPTLSARAHLIEERAPCWASGGSSAGPRLTRTKGGEQRCTKWISFMLVAVLCAILMGSAKVVCRGDLVRCAASHGRRRATSHSAHQAREQSFRLSKLPGWTSRPPWGSVEGSLDRACRGADEADVVGDYYETNDTMVSLESCRDFCAGAGSCAGVGYDMSTGRCAVWTRPIGASTPAPGFACLRYLVLPSSARRPPWGLVDGGAGRACRGAGADDDSDSHYTLHDAVSSLGECQGACAKAASCMGIEYSAAGRCKVWTRPIGASVVGSSCACLRYLKVPAWVVHPLWKEVDGGVDRACRSALPAHNVTDDYTLLGSIASLDECKRRCAGVEACRSIEFNVSGWCKLWRSSIAFGVRRHGSACLRYDLPERDFPEVDYIYLPESDTDAARTRRMLREYDRHVVGGRSVIRMVPGVYPDLWPVGGRYDKYEYFARQLPGGGGPRWWRAVSDCDIWEGVREGRKHHEGCKGSHFVTWMDARARGLGTMLVAESDGFPTMFQRATGGAIGEFDGVVRALLVDAPAGWQFIQLDRGMQGVAHGENWSKEIFREGWRRPYRIYKWQGTGIAGLNMYMVSRRFLDQLPQMIHDHRVGMVDAYMDMLCGSGYLQCYSLSTIEDPWGSATTSTTPGRSGGGGGHHRLQE